MSLFIDLSDTLKALIALGILMPNVDTELIKANRVNSVEDFQQKPNPKNDILHDSTSTFNKQKCKQKYLRRLSYGFLTCVR